MADRAPERKVRDLTGMLNRAGHVLAQRLSAALAEVGLSPRTQCVLVHALEAERTQAELAALADLDKTTMVATVDELEQAGLAHRVASPRDRRARIVSVTERGRAAALAGQEIVDRVHAEALADLEAEEGVALVEALARLIEGNLAAPAVPSTAGSGERPVRRRRRANTAATSSLSR